MFCIVLFHQNHLCIANQHLGFQPMRRRKVLNPESSLTGGSNGQGAVGGKVAIENKNIPINAGEGEVSSAIFSICTIKQKFKQIKPKNIITWYGFIRLKFTVSYVIVEFLVSVSDSRVLVVVSSVMRKARSCHCWINCWTPTCKSCDHGWSTMTCFTWVPVVLRHRVGWLVGWFGCLVVLVCKMQTWPFKSFFRCFYRMKQE